MISDQKFWKISPGSSGMGWKDCLDKGIIGIGWNYEKDLHGLSEEKVFEYIKKTYSGKVAKQFVDFIFNIKKGDTIVAYSSPSTIYGIGIVEKSEWVFNDNVDDPWLAHTRKIRWDKKTSEIKVSTEDIKKILGKNRTLFGIPQDFFIKRILPLLPKESDIWTFLSSHKMSRDLPILNLLDQKSQVVLYGPPGTGKTYKAREYAVNFIEKTTMEG